MFRRHKANKLAGYTDFVMNKDKFLFSIKYNWEDNAQEFYSTWVPEITGTVGQMFSFVMHTSAQSYSGSQELDNLSIRNIVYLYIQRIFGVDQSDQFDYQTVNKLLPIPFKVYVKKIACYPQSITSEVYRQADSLLIPARNSRQTGLKTSVAASDQDQIEVVQTSVRDKLFMNLVVIESKK